MSKNKAFVIDTNVLIRFLTNDNASQSSAAKKLFKGAFNNSLLIPDLVIAEVVYVLLSVYGLDKQEIISRIRSIINFEKFDANKRLISMTLDIYSENNLSFVDSYLLALKTLNKAEKIYSFDKKMQKISKDVVSP